MKIFMIKIKKIIMPPLAFFFIFSAALISLSPYEAGAVSQPFFSAGRVKYKGGGDWYNDPEVLPNMLGEFEKRAGVKCYVKEVVVTPDQPKIFELPFLYLTGHGNLKLETADIENLRKYLLNGGFLYVDDDYGLDESFRREVKKLFPEYELKKVPDGHPLFDCFYKFAEGLPKIHEHDAKAPEAFAIFHENRIVLLYTYESNISDGWADPKTHNDPPEVRETAFKMGVNILYYSLISNQAELAGGNSAPDGERTTGEVNAK